MATLSGGAHFGWWSDKEWNTWAGRGMTEAAEVLTQKAIL